MLFSIVVLSYNRPEQINRILIKLQSASAGDFNLIIKDDCSPRQDEIRAIVESYSGKHNFDVIFYKNKSNLGYDRNLLDAFNVTESEYVFLLSDDDYIGGERIVDLIQVLSRREYKLYFTPYIDKSSECRTNIENFNINKFNEVIYNSILFSGLIFHRRSVIELPKDESFLSNCIYSQVFLASLIAYKERGFGRAPSALLYLGGDGENFFGENQSAVNREVLRNRTSITSNLKYQNFLLTVVEKISKSTDKSIYKIFIAEYNRRLVSYLLRARSLGWADFRELTTGIKNSNFDPAWHVKLAMYLFLIIPDHIAKSLHRRLVTYFKKSG